MLMAYTFAGGVTTELRGGATLHHYDSEGVDLPAATPATMKSPVMIRPPAGYGGIAVRYAIKSGVDLIGDVQYSRADGGETGVSVYLGVDYKL